jgi:hypothetical protein
VRWPPIYSRQAARHRLAAAPRLAPLASLLACLSGCGFQRHDSPDRARLIAPLSTSFFATPSPTLRFALPATLTDPVVELCHSRACDGPLGHATFDAASNSATPDQPLTPGLWYWRVRTQSPAGMATSAVWQFRVVSGTSGAVWGGELDLNGDGFEELAVGAPTAMGQASGLPEGRVYVYAGGPGGPDPSHVTVLDAPASGGFGFSLATVDFNGDGFSDLAVGAPQARSGDGGEGVVYVYYGGANGLRTTPDLLFSVPTASGLGWSLDSARDFNGDGFGDLVMGAPSSAFQGEITGIAYIASGGANGNGLFAPLQPEWGPLFMLGASVAGGGDIDGDGRDDVLVGAPGASPGGHVWAILSANVGGDPRLLDVGAPNNALFGYSLVFRGDVDGDGLSDFAVGEPADGPGRVHLYQGQRGQMPIKVGQLDGPDGNMSRFGISLAGGDGSSQLAVAANCAPGGAPCNGRVYLNPGPGVTLYDGPPSSLYGTGLALLDADGDGQADLAIGTADYASELGRVDYFRDTISSSLTIFNGSDAAGRYGYVLR